MPRGVLICLALLLTVLLPVSSYGGNAGLYTWGRNNRGQLGDGTNRNKREPVRISSADIVAIAGGGYHSLALKKDGTVLAWGDNGDGQIGDDTTLDRKSPVQVHGLQSVKAISSGRYHSLALKNDGTVWAWGCNEFGQLGNGTNENKKLPTQVSDLQGVQAIAAGHFHSLALKSDGSVWAWGMNAYSQLGDDTTEDRSTPVKVKHLFFDGDERGVKAIAAGGYHSLAIMHAEGAVMAWGSNNFGQLGWPRSMMSSGGPIAIILGGTNDWWLLGVIEIAVGRNHSLALKSDGTVWAWGDNGHGQLGEAQVNPNAEVWHDWGAMRLANFNGARQIAAGNDHSLVLKTDGTFWAWGANTFGQLGDGTIADKRVPVRVLNISEGLLVGAGAEHSLAIKRSNGLFMRKDNGGMVPIDKMVPLDGR